MSSPMQCASCNADLTAADRFCGECGAPVAMVPTEAATNAAVEATIIRQPAAEVEPTVTREPSPALPVVLAPAALPSPASPGGGGGRRRPVWFLVGGIVALVVLALLAFALVRTGGGARLVVAEYQGDDADIFVSSMGSELTRDGQRLSNVAPTSQISQMVDGALRNGGNGEAVLVGDRLLVLSFDSESSETSLVESLGADEPENTILTADGGMGVVVLEDGALAITAYNADSTSCYLVEGSDRPQRLYAGSGCGFSADYQTLLGYERSDPTTTDTESTDSDAVPADDAEAEFDVTVMTVADEDTLADFTVPGYQLVYSPALDRIGVYESLGDEGERATFYTGTGDELDSTAVHATVTSMMFSAAGTASVLGDAEGVMTLYAMGPDGVLNGLGTAEAAQVALSPDGTSALALRVDADDEATVERVSFDESAGVTTVLDGVSEATSMVVDPGGNRAILYSGTDDVAASLLPFDEAEAVSEIDLGNGQVTETYALGGEPYVIVDEEERNTLWRIDASTGDAADIFDADSFGLVGIVNDSLVIEEYTPEGTGTTVLALPLGDDSRATEIYDADSVSSLVLADGDRLVLSGRTGDRADDVEVVAASLDDNSRPEVLYDGAALLATSDVTQVVRSGYLSQWSSLTTSQTLSEDERIQQAIDSTGCTDPTDLSFGTPVGSAGDACYLVSSPNEAERSFSLAPTSGDYASFTLYYVDPATGEATSTYTGETPYECIVQGYFSCDTYAYLPLNGSMSLTEGTYVLTITGGHTFRLQG